MDNFNSKVLLFGEYSIIKGSSGLAIPFEKFSGKLEFDSNHENDGKVSLFDLAKYLQNSSILSKNIDVESFLKDIENGIYFNSNIPQGYGVGSSGALCASILAKYGRNISRTRDYSVEDLRFLQDIMALMESFYHGTSSGLDPLISFVNQPVFIKGRNEIEITPIKNHHEFGSFYLVDSGFKRNTSPLVHRFMKMCEDKVFAPKLDQMVINCNELIESFLEGRSNDFESLLHDLSRFQYLYFETMIPKNLKELWFTGLESRKFHLKLCGAGGGGFLLAYLYEDNIELLNGLNLTKISL